MSKTCLHISFAIILTLFVVNLNANPKPKADNGIDIIINRVGPMVGPRMLGLRKNWKVNQVISGPKPGTGAGDWAMMLKNPSPKEVETDHQNLRLTNGRFMTISSQFFGNYINIFYNTEVQTVILIC